MNAGDLARSFRRRRSGRARGVALLALLLLATALLVAACGGPSAAPSVASLGATTSTTHATTSGAAAPGSDGSDPAAASGGSPSSQSSSSMKLVGGSLADEMKLATCMRANGVPSFPDPNAQGVISGSGFDPQSAAFQKAMQSCRKVMPNGGVPTPAQQAQAKTQMLKYSSCMRSHGLSNFPEPNAQGDLQVKFSSSNGLDPNSPQFQAAQKACASLAPGGGAGP